MEEIKLPPHSYRVFMNWLGESFAGRTMIDPLHVVTLARDHARQMRIIKEIANELSRRNPEARS